MNGERWQRVKHLLDEAIALSTAERQSFLEQSCKGDLDPRSEIESLLASHDQTGAAFLENPAANLKSPRLPLQVGRRIGAYEVPEKIGQGGMGEVYRAVRADGQYTKEVAVKLVLSGVDSGSVLERFRNERQIPASLDHPNIARLLDGGTTDEGVPYLVMELIAGNPVDAHCDEQRLSISKRLELFRQVCGAVQFAHQRLVIHGDIKPSNILVTKEGVPKLLDFGIAKILDRGAMEGLTAADRGNGPYRLALADTLPNVGRVHVRLAGRAKEPSTSLRHWTKARSFYQRSQELLLELRKTGKLPSTRSGALQEVSGELARCDESLAKLQQAH